MGGITTYGEMFLVLKLPLSMRILKKRKIKVGITINCWGLGSSGLVMMVLVADRKVISPRVSAGQDRSNDCDQVSATIISNPRKSPHTADVSVLMFT